MNKYIKIPENKDIDLDMMINLYLDPLNIYIPIFKKEKFKLNTYIYKNTYFDNFISSVSGKISGSKKVIINGKSCPALEVTNDFKENVLKKNKKKKIKNKEELIQILNDYHLIDIIKKMSNKDIKNLVITSVDEDIYSYNELMILANYANKICNTITELLNILNIDTATIAVKNTFFKAIKNLKAIIGTYPNIDLKLLNDYYLISYDTFICKELNIKEENSLILTSNDIYNLYNVLIKGNIINEKFVTISGNAVLKSLVIKTRLGISIEELITKLVKITNSEYEIYLNGPIKGEKINDISNYIITNDIRNIVINKREEKQIVDCINCGVCYKVCPFNINVINYYNKNKKCSKCSGCGLCNYVCPANIDLKSKVYGGKHE